MYAVIDIGTNSVRLLLAEYENGKVHRLSKDLITTRLGDGIAENPNLRVSAMERTAEAVDAFVKKTRAVNAENVWVFGTSALRDAPNKYEFLSRVRNKCGCEVEIIPGEKEALLGYVGAFGSQGTGNLLDVGGGSTELSAGADGKPQVAMSVPVGTVRLRDICRDGYGRISDGDRTRMLAYIDERITAFADVKTTGNVLTGIGGTATTLAAIDQALTVYDPKKIEGYELSYETVCALTDKLAKMTLEQKKSLNGLMPQRADVIVGGAMIVCRVMETKGFTCLRTSESDNLEGYLSLKLL